MDDGLWFYIKWLDDIGDKRIRHHDLVSARYDEDAAREFGLSALPRKQQAEIMRALEAHLHPIKRIAKGAPTSYALKHAAEDYIGRYVSDTQARTVMRLLGYKESATGYYPRYNVSMRDWRRFRDGAQKARNRREAEREFFFKTGALAHDRCVPKSECPLA